MSTIDLIPLALAARYLDLSSSRLRYRVLQGETTINGWRFVKLGQTWWAVPPYETATPREVTREQVEARIEQQAQDAVNS